MIHRQQHQFLAIVLIIIAFITGYFFGFKNKTITSLEPIVTHDTSFHSYPIEVEKKVSNPINKPFKDGVVVPITLIKKKDSVIVHDTIRIETTFTGTDTFRYKGIWNAISDTGNCNGVISRVSQFGGVLEERIITTTIEKPVILPQPFFQINAGITSAFSNQWNIKDIGPTVQLSFKQKHQLGYTYQIEQKLHNFTLTTKIK